MKTALLAIAIAGALSAPAAAAPAPAIDVGDRTLVALPTLVQVRVPSTPGPRATKFRIEFGDRAALHRARDGVTRLTHVYRRRGVYAITLRYRAGDRDRVVTRRVRIGGRAPIPIDGDGPIVRTRVEPVTLTPGASAVVPLPATVFTRIDDVLHSPPAYLSVRIERGALVVQADPSAPPGGVPLTVMTRACISVCEDHVWYVWVDVPVNVVPAG